MRGNRRLAFSPASEPEDSEVRDERLASCWRCDWRWLRWVRNRRWRRRCTRTGVRIMMNDMMNGRMVVHRRRRVVDWRWVINRRRVVGVHWGSNADKEAATAKAPADPSVETSTVETSAPTMPSECWR
jgi:hypothetical protein